MINPGGTPPGFLMVIKQLAGYNLHANKIINNRAVVIFRKLFQSYGKARQPTYDRTLS